MSNKVSRMRRAKKTRLKLKELNKVRLCVNKTPRHIYAQIISGDGSKTLVSASTQEKEIKEQCGYTGNVDSSKVLGKIIAERSLLKEIKEVSFDRSGFKYHGRIKALAESARQNGLIF